MTSATVGLIASAARRLAALPNEMAGDVAHRLERVGTAGDRSADPRGVPARAALAPLLEAVARRDDPLLEALADCASALAWQTAPPESCPESFAGRHAFVELFGPDGVVAGDDLRMGLFLLEPDVFYPPHRHAAEELYLVLAGQGAWQLSDSPFREMKSGEFVQIAPLEPHAIRTGERPVLALWAWRGDIGFESYSYL